MDPLRPGWRDLDPAGEHPPCRPQRYVNLEAERVLFDSLDRVEALEAAIWRAWRRPRATAWTCAPRSLAEALVRRAFNKVSSVATCLRRFCAAEHIMQRGWLMLGVLSQPVSARAQRAGSLILTRFL